MFGISTIAEVKWVDNIFDTSFDTSLIFENTKPGEFESLPIDKRTYQQELYLIEKRESKQRRQEKALEDFFRPLTAS